MTLERARGHDGWRARRPDLSQPSQAARSRNSASAPRYERPMSRRPGASAVATPTSTGQNAEVLTDAASVSQWASGGAARRGRSQVVLSRPGTANVTARRWRLSSGNKLELRVKR
jgi:hypothetical protein